MTLNFDKRSGVTIAPYVRVVYDTHILSSSTEREDGVVENRIDLSRMKSKYLFILAGCDEILTGFKNMFTYSSNMTHDNEGEK